jgi:hypothetical protein
MSLNGPSPTFKANLHVIPSKPRIKKHNYGVTKKLQNFLTTKLQWAKLCLRSNGNLHTIKCRIYTEVEGKLNCLPLNGILFESMHVTKIY